MEPNIIVVNKPKGITSFDVIRRLRKTLGIRKMGHAGTLDPLASGLMIIGIGAGTKKLSHYLKLPKVYEAEVLLGRRTATGDMEGEVLEEAPVLSISRDEIGKILSSMKGKISLPVPAYSAIKKDGVPLYRKARQGKEVIPPIKEMEILWSNLRSTSPYENGFVLSIELEVASGTYIRSIAEEIGRRLGVPATIKELRRTKIGTFTIDEAQAV